MSCDLKNICDAYQGKKHYSMLKKDFKETCESSLFIPNMCELYKIYSKSLNEVYEKLQKNMNKSSNIEDKTQKMMKSLRQIEFKTS